MLVSTEGGGGGGMGGRVKLSFSSIAAGGADGVRSSDVSQSSKSSG